MLKITCRLTGISPIGFSAPIQSTKATGEGHDAFEERTWRERLPVDAEGKCIIAPMRIKNCLSDVAKYLSETVPGKGKATFTKHFESGILCVDAVPLYDGNGKTVSRESVEGLKLFVPSDGKRGGGTRVWKWFPVIQTWYFDPVIYALDPVLIDKQEKIEEYLSHAGKFIGVGWFRPRRNGYFGRFNVSNFKAVKEA